MFGVLHFICLLFLSFNIFLLVVCNLPFVATTILSINIDVFVRGIMLEGNLISFWIFGVRHESGRFSFKIFC